MILRSQALVGVVHGFSTRQGGVSTGRYASLNLGGKWGDSLDNVVENRRRFCAALPLDERRLHLVRQVHGARVVVLGPEDGPEASAVEEADALVTREPGWGLGILTADCVPVLLSGSGGVVGAAHAGWRGAVAGVIESTVEAMRSLGANPQELRAGLGPSICVRCFEVGEDVAERFATTPGAVARGGERPHVDLRRDLRERLVSSGLVPDHIDAEPPCTMCEPERFFSFRRDGGQIGQQLSVIAS